MQLIPALALLLGAQAMAMITPGPNMALMLAVTREPPRSLMLVVAGFACAGLVFSVLSVAMLSGLWVKGFDIARPALQLLGALYLAWVGAGFLRTASSGNARASIPTSISNRPWFAIGFLTNAANPKTLAFFSSILAIYLAQVGTDSYPKLLAVAGIFINSLLVHWSLGRLLRTESLQRSIARRGALITGVSGALFLVFAAGFGVAAVVQLGAALGAA